jgi:cell wall-associated NlpC family hydrolase
MTTLARPQWETELDQAASAYGVNPALVHAINQRENSGSDAFTINTTDSNAAAGHPSGGPMQYIAATFAGNARRARAANPAAWRGVDASWRNPYAQALAASWAISTGHGQQWSTYSKALQDAGGTVRGSSQTLPAPVSAPSGASAGGSSPSGTFSKPARAALASMFDTNPGMKRVLGLVDQYDQLHPRVDVVRPTADAAAGVVGGAGGGPQGQQLVATALAEVGKTANDAMRYIKAAGGKGYEAWCGDFVQWVFKQRGLQPPPARSVPALMQWAAKNHRLVSNPRPGDLVTFDWNGDGKADHVEMVRKAIRGGVASVGGNTSGPKPGMQVAAKNRTSNILGYVRAA